ncbi:hypothetical protein EON63_17960 [archaeon]|nr:MAG: hypothetical protein EON63_17960 [archaeon]
MCGIWQHFTPSLPTRALDLLEGQWVSGERYLQEAGQLTRILLQRAETSWQLQRYTEEDSAEVTDPSALDLIDVEI